MKRLLIPLLACLALSACNREPSPELAATAEANLAASTSFMADNAHKQGVVTLKDGIQYRVVTSVKAGEKPGPRDEVKVHYEGKVAASGQVFDSSFDRGAPAIFALDEVVPGWSEALQAMRPGEEWIIWLSPEKGYGENDLGEIPPNSALEFRVQLIAVAPKPALG